MIRIRTLDPADEDWSDLRPMAPLLADAKVIGIGESAHYTREFALLKHRLLRFLVVELGVTAFAMESGFPEGLAVGRWLAGRDDDLDGLLERGFTNGFGNSSEMRDQLLWMRSRGIRFYGIDIPGTGWSPSAAISELERGQPGIAHTLRTEFAGLTSAIGRPPIDSERHAAIKSLLARIADNLRPRAAVDADAAVMSQCVAGLLTYAEIAAAPQTFDTRRDEWMAESVARILTHEHRIVLGGANAHIQRVAYPVRGGELTVLGQHLSSSLGSGYAAIGTTFGNGSVRLTGKLLSAMPTGDPAHWEETVDHLLASEQVPVFAIETKWLPQPSAQRQFSDVVSIDVRRAFDLLIHVHEFGPATPARHDADGPRP